MQKTLKNNINYTGIGLHSGCNVNVTIIPAPENTGIVFRRTDLPAEPEVKALYSNVCDTRNCTCIKSGDAVVSTIEHIMAALFAYEIDNAVIKIDNMEFPIMDGSAKMFCDLFEKAGIVEQNAPQKYLKITQKIEFSDDKGNIASLEPVEGEKLEVCCCIDFPSKIVGHQEFCADVDRLTFAAQIAPARTFCEKYQVDYLRSIGLIKGGSLENAIVLDGETILNPEGFRLDKECVRHKVLDAVGDLYTSGYRIIGKFNGFHTGHFHNNELLKKLFGNSASYVVLEK